MRVWTNQNGLIIGINDETGLAFLGFFNEFTLAVVYGDFIRIPTARIIRANFRGKYKRFVLHLFSVCENNRVCGVVFLRV